MRSMLLLNYITSSFAALKFWSEASLIGKRLKFPFGRNSQVWIFDFWLKRERRLIHCSLPTQILFPHKLAMKLNCGWTYNDTGSSSPSHPWTWIGSWQRLREQRIQQPRALTPQPFPPFLFPFLFFFRLLCNYLFRHPTFQLSQQQVGGTSISRYKIVIRLIGSYMRNPKVRRFEFSILDAGRNNQGSPLFLQKHAALLTFSSWRCPICLS